MKLFEAREPGQRLSDGSLEAVQLAALQGEYAQAAQGAEAGRQRALHAAAAATSRDVNGSMSSTAAMQAAGRSYGSLEQASAPHTRAARTA